MTGAFPFLSSVFFRRILLAGAFLCAVLLMTVHGPAPAQTADPEPNYNDPQLCATLGGTLLPVAGENVCRGLDATGTFCIVGSKDAFPCRGLYKHVDYCNKLNRPTLNPFICGPVCANGAALGGTCQLSFAEAALTPGQPFTVTLNSAGTYHGQRRALHFVYFTESNILRENPDAPPTFADHAAQCALGNPENETGPWRPPTLAETAILLAETSHSFAVISDAETAGNPLPGSEFQAPLPPDTCAGQCAPPLEQLSAAAGNAARVFPGNIIRPEILTRARPSPPLGIQNEQDLLNPPKLPPAFTRAPHRADDAGVIFPCVAPVAAGYASPPLDFRIQITPAGVPIQTGETAQILFPAYAAPNAPDIAVGAPLFTVSAVARRWTLDAQNNPAFSTHLVPVTLHARVGETDRSFPGVGRIVRPIPAPNPIPARETVFISVSLYAAPQVGPAASEIFQYAHIPVKDPPAVTVIANATVAHAEITFPPQMAGSADIGNLTVTTSRLPGEVRGVRYEVDLPNARLIRRGPLPTQAENPRARYTHPNLRGNLVFQFTFRPPPRDAAPGEFVPANELKRGGFTVFHTQKIPLFTLTSFVPATQFEFVQPMHNDPLNYLGFAHRAVDNLGGMIEFSAIPLSVQTAPRVPPPATVFFAKNPPGFQFGWYPAFLVMENFDPHVIFTFSRARLTTATPEASADCQQVAGTTRLVTGNNWRTNIPGGTSERDVWRCPSARCEEWVASSGSGYSCPAGSPARVIFGDFFPKRIRQSDAQIISDASDLPGRPTDDPNLQPDPPNFAPTESEIVLIDLHPTHRARCLPVAEAKTQNLIPPEHPAADSVLFCPPPRRIATVILAAQNAGYKTRPLNPQYRAPGGALLPQTIHAAALLTLEITVAIRTEGIAFNPDQWFPPDNTANLLRNSDERGKQRYHPARVAPNFASQITTETSGQNSETLIRHPVMIVPIPPRIRHDIAIPPDSGFAFTIVARSRTPIGKITQTGDLFEGEGRGHPHYPAEIRYVENQATLQTDRERLLIFYVPPNRPIPPQTSRAAVVRFTVYRTSENGQTQTPVGAAQLTLSLTAVAQMPIHDAATTELNERYNYWNRVPVQDVVPPEVLGMQNVFPELINENLLKDGTMTYLGAYRPKLQPGHVHNPHAFTIIAQDEPAAFAMRLNSTLTSNLGLLPRPQRENHTPLFAGDHILSVKYSNPNVFLGEYHMTFRAHIPPASESSTDYWDAGWSMEEGVRRMLSFTPEQIGEVVIDQSGTLIKNYPWTKSMILDNDNPPLTGLEEALLYQKWTAEWLTRVQTELNAYVANPEITVFLDGEVPPNNYHAAIERAVEWMVERIAYDDSGSFIPPPYVGFSLAHLGYYSPPTADRDATRRSIATFLYRHQPSNRIMRARLAEGFTGTLFTYDPQLSYQRQSADVRARIPPDAPNRFELPNGLAGMFVQIPSGVILSVQTRDGQPTRVTAQTGGGYLEVVETGDGRLQISVPLPLDRFPPPLPVAVPPAELKLEPPTRPDEDSAGKIFTPLPPPRGSGDGEFFKNGNILKRKPPPNYAAEPQGTRVPLTAAITIQEVRSYVTVDAVLYVDLTVENGADFGPVEMPLSEAREGESFPVILPLPERGRFPAGGEWFAAVSSSLSALTLRGDGRIALTRDIMQAGEYRFSLEYAPRGEEDLLGRIPYVFILRALKTEGDAAAELAEAAAAGNQAEVWRLLRESPVRGTAKASNGPYAGKTPLHAALMGFTSSDSPDQTEARINIVWKLVENGANHWTTDDEGLAPMHRAMHSAAHNNTTLPIRALATAPFPSGDWYEAKTVTAYKNSRSRQTEIDDKVTITARYALGPESAVMADGFTIPLRYAADQELLVLNAGNTALANRWARGIIEFARFYGTGTGCNISLGETGLPGCIRQELNLLRNAMGETQLHTAVRMQQTMTVEALLAGGADVNAGLVSPIDIGNSPSPMHYAISLADFGVVDLLARGFEKPKTSGECPLGIIPTVIGVNFSGGGFAMTVSECRVRTNYKPGGSWIQDPINYPSVAITPPIYATILLAEALSASPQDGGRITMLQEISLLLNPGPTTTPKITATITPAQLTGVAKEVYDWLIVAVNTRGEPAKSGVKIVRDAFLNYLNGDDYFAPIGAFRGKITNDDNTSLINAVAGAFVNGGADPDNKCALESDLSGSAFYDCGFSAVPRLEGVVVEISVVVPDSPIINRVVGADFFTETYTVYWRPPLYDGGSRITAYQLRRTQQPGGGHKFSHPSKCDELTDSDYSVQLNPQTLPVTDNFAYMSARAVRGSSYAGVANGTCYRWHLRALNEAGMSSEVTTDPILSRGFLSSGNVWTDWDTTRSRPGDAIVGCNPGNYRPYSYNNQASPDAGSWGGVCVPASQLGRSEICHSHRADGHTTSYDTGPDACLFVADDSETLCTSLGHERLPRAINREWCKISPPCGTLSEYNVHHRECQCQNWAQPTATADDGSPSECECKVSGADANCACPSPKQYDPESHSCI